MKIGQNGMMMNKKRPLFRSQALVWLFLVLQTVITQAGAVTLKSVDFAALSGNKLQIQFEMDGKASAPKVFQTDNPARLALDFQGVKSGLKTKKHNINVGVASSLYAVEASGRLRVVVNLLETVPYDVKIDGNKVFVTLNGGKHAINKVAKRQIQTRASKRSSALAKLLPKQRIEKLDFRRGSNGEGRLIISLSNPNTVVNAQEQGDKIILNFLNTSLPSSWAKKMDVMDFATPVKTINAKSRGLSTRIEITPVNSNYQYSSFQTNGRLTVEFRPLTPIEQEMRKVKFPYDGERLSLNFQDIEVRSVLQILADFTELNIIASDTVAGNVTLRLNDVPWDQALDLVLKSKGLAKRKTGNVILVGPTAEISKMEKDELESKHVQQQLEPLVTEYIKINFARAENFRNLLNGQDTGAFGDCGIQTGSQGGSATSSSGQSRSQNGLNNSRGNSNSGIRKTSRDSLFKDGEFSLLSDRGVALVDSRTNTLIIRETAGRIAEMKKLIRRLDVPVKQVLIEARVVSANESFARDLGTKFGVAKTSQLESDKQFTFGGGGLGSTKTLETLSSALSASSGGALAMTLARGADYVLNLEIRALQDEGNGESISNPRILTSDRCLATIRQGTDIPFPTVSQNGTQTEFKKAVLELTVTPQITPSGKVIMELKVSKNSPGAVFAGGVGIDTKELMTNVQVNDGETVVLGGVYEGSSSNSYSTVPWLADLPGVGWMFQKKNKNNNKSELLIFITPKIVKEAMKI